MNEFIQYPEPGKKYRHYKGGLYEVICLCPHTETTETLVIYKSLIFGSFYARPLSMWFDVVKPSSVELGYDLTRFTLEEK